MCRCHRESGIGLARWLFAPVPRSRGKCRWFLEWASCNFPAHSSSQQCHWPSLQRRPTHRHRNSRQRRGLFSSARWRARWSIPTLPVSAPRNLMLNPHAVSARPLAVSRWEMTCAVNKTERCLPMHFVHSPEWTRSNSMFKAVACSSPRMHSGNADALMLRFPSQKSKRSLPNNKPWQMFRRSYFACAGAFANRVVNCQIPTFTF